MAVATLDVSDQTMVMLKAGLSVPLPALQTLWSLEHRGLDIRLTESGMLAVGPPHHLNDDDRARIRQYRDALIALVGYCEAVQ